MAIVVEFPHTRRTVRDTHLSDGQRGSATIIILPVVRIERQNGEPSDGLNDGSSASGRKRRRRATRS